MLWIWLVLGAVARGQAVDVVAAAAMVRDLVPEVERRAGRPFVHVPEVDIDTRAGLRARLLQPPVQMVFASNLGKADEAYQPPPQWVKDVDHLVTDAMAVYVDQDERIYLVKSTLEDIQRELQLRKESLRPLLRCVLVHELVHALQHQYGVQDESGAEQVRGRLALHEGHAAHIAGEYCAEVEGPAMGQLLDVIQGLEIEGSLDPDEGAAVYSWGRRLARALDDEGLLWSAMVGPAPTWSGIVDAIRPTHAPGWRSADPLAAAIARLDPAIELEDAVPASPTTHLTTYLKGDFGFHTMPEALGGFAIEGAKDGEAVLLAAFLLDELGHTEKVLAIRRAHVLGTRSRGVPMMVYEKADGMLAQSPKAKLRDADLPGRVSVLRVTTRTTGDGPYQEYWFATERRLVVFFASGRKFSPRDVVDTVGGLLAEMSGDRGAPFDLGAMGEWIEAVRDVDPAISQHANWDYLLGRVVERVARGERGSCLSVFDRPLRDETIPDRVPYARTAFECAAVTADVGLAQRALRILPEVEPYAAVSLASKLANEKRPREALAMLDKADVDGTMSVELIRVAAEIRITASVQLRRWDAVSRGLRANPGLDPQLRAYAGSELFLVGRRAEGRRILAEACPELSAGEQAKCRAFLSAR